MDGLDWWSVQMVSIYMSFFTLSMTSSSFLFLQHSEYVIFNEKKQRRSRGIYDPNLIHVMLCTLLYTFVNIPRQWANALIFSISPIFAVIMFSIELGLHLLYSHFYVRKLNNNLAFPSGTVTAFTNFISVCGPFEKIGKLNLFSNILLAIKVIILYPVTHLEALTIEMCNDPDIFRCWNQTAVNDVNHCGNVIHNITSPPFRVCSPGEDTNDLLFNVVLPTTLGLLVISVLFGYFITFLMKKVTLEYIDSKIKLATEYLSNQTDKLKQRFNRCFKCCAKDNDTNAIDYLEQCVNVEENLKSDSAEIDTPLNAESSADNNDIETMGDEDHIVSEQNSSDESESDREQIVSQDNATHIQIKQEISSEQVEENGESCCGVMGFFENVRTLFDPDENDDDCKYLFHITIA